MAIFQNRIFQGPNLDRLVQCLLAVRDAGLELSENSHADVNPNSGDIWIWDEVWAGTVSCSLGFDIQWGHSCSECGKKYAFEDYDDLENYVADYAGYCEACTEEN